MLELGSDTTRAILELLVTLLQQMDSLPLNDEDRYDATRTCAGYKIMS